MKLARVGSSGNEKPILIDDQDNYRDISSIIKDLDPITLNFETLDKIKKLKIRDLPTLDKNQRIGACVSNPAKFIGIGLNFKDHAKEQNLTPPSDPVIVMKPRTALCGTAEDVICPSFVKDLDYEVELAVIIGKECKNISETPLGRVATTDDVAKIAAFLASSESDFHTGMSILVDGGKNMN